MQHVLVQSVRDHIMIGVHMTPNPTLVRNLYAVNVQQLRQCKAACSCDQACYARHRWGAHLHKRWVQVIALFDSNYWGTQALEQYSIRV